MYSPDTFAAPYHPEADTRGRAPKALRLRAVDGALLALERRIGEGLGAQLQLGAATVSLELSGARIAAGSVESTGGAMRLQTPHGTLTLSPAREIVRALSAIDLPDDAEDDPLRSLRMDLAMQGMPEGWLALFGASVVLAATPEHTPGALQTTLSVFQRPARLGLAVTLRGDEGALQHALSQPAWQPLHDEPQPAIDGGVDIDLQDELPVHAPVRIGTTTLPVSIVRALSRGDVVPIQQAFFDLEGEGEVRIAKGTARALLHTGNQPSLELTEWHPMTTGKTMNELNPPRYDEDGDSALDDLPVTLSFDLGALELTLAQLRELGPGSVLPVGGAVPPQVSICAGQRRLGTGELVELDGQLAVEIRRMGAAT